MDDLQKLGLRVSTHAPACHKHAPACKRGSIRMHPSTLAKLCPLIQSLQALQRKLLNNDLGHHTWPEAEQGQPPRLESCDSDRPPAGSSHASGPPQEGLLPPPSHRQVATLPQPARRRDVGQHPSPSQPTPLSPRVANKTRILRLRLPPHRLPARLTASPRGPVASC